MTSELWIPSSARGQNFKKAAPPKLGPSFGNWAGHDSQFLTLPGGGVIQFDLTKLTLADYRAMRDHYQINSSLAVLSFMVHQLDWRIEGGTAKSRAQVEENVRIMWTRIIRGFGQAFWAGYSPNALEYENDLQAGNIVLSKVKDLIPEECRINWKTVDGYAPPGHAKPRFKEYDGIKQVGATQTIPPENSLWFPLLMENGDYYGKKLLKPAFPSWFFSILIHLFANRYYERFGEPTPVGRADFEDTVEMDGQSINGRDAMGRILTNLRNRGVVILPSDRMPVGDGTRSEYAYNIEYLESQMRGGDFERYLTRLDEEMSIGLFTPILLMRTADVGSYNLGVSHMQMYLWMLNALAGDIKEYMDRYIVNRLKDFNYGPNHPRMEWVPRKLGKENMETNRAIVTELLRSGKIEVDYEELSTITGLTIEKAKEVVEPPPDPNAVVDEDPDAVPVDERPPRQRPGRQAPRGVGEPRATTKRIAARLAEQGQLAGRSFKLPLVGAFRESLKADGWHPDAAQTKTDRLFGQLNAWLAGVLEVKAFADGKQLAEAFQAVIEPELVALEARTAS